MSINKDTSEVSDAQRARASAEKEIRMAGLDPDGQEAAFHRLRTMAFGTMGVQPPGLKLNQDEQKETLPWIDPDSGVPWKMTPHLRGGQR